MYVGPGYGVMGSISLLVFFTHDHIPFSGTLRLYKQRITAIVTGTRVQRALTSQMYMIYIVRYLTRCRAER